MFAVLAVLICTRTTSETDHEVDTRSGEAHCTTCGAMTIVEPADLLDLLEG